jgi:hypothetical protein
MAAQAADTKKKEIYTYEAPWQIYGMNWSVRPDQKFRLAGTIGPFAGDQTYWQPFLTLLFFHDMCITVGSFIEEYNNKVCLVFHISSCWM